MFTAASKTLALLLAFKRGVRSIIHPLQGLPKSIEKSFRFISCNYPSEQRPEVLAQTQCVEQHIKDRLGITVERNTCKTVPYVILGSLTLEQVFASVSQEKSYKSPQYSNQERAHLSFIVFPRAPSKRHKQIMATHTLREPVPKGAFKMLHFKVLK